MSSDPNEDTNDPIFHMRALTPVDNDAHRALMFHAFRGGQIPRPAEGTDSDDTKNTLGLFDTSGENLMASVTTLPFGVHWGERTVLKMGGIAGVATYAHARGQGLVNELLVQSLRWMRERGEVVSALYPFAFAFYRRYGWDWVGERHSYDVLPLREIKSAPEGRNVVALDSQKPETRARIAPAYTTYARGFRGVFTGETHLWNEVLENSDNKTTHVYAYINRKTDACEGYFLWRFEGDKGGIREFVANTPESWRGLLSTLHYLGVQTKNARVGLPQNSLLTQYVMHWEMERKASPVFMARVVDVAGALSQIEPPTDMGDGGVLIGIRDEHAPWNNGTWRIAVEGGTVTCSSVQATVPPAIQFDIQAFSQAFWGYPNLQQLRAAGRLEAGEDEDGFAFLSELLPAAPVFTMDGF